jgi:hypothetical protein
MALIWPLLEPISPLTAPISSLLEPISSLMAPVPALPKELEQPHVAPPEQALAQARGSSRQDLAESPELPKPRELRDRISRT